MQIILTDVSCQSFMGMVKWFGFFIWMCSEIFMACEDTGHEWRRKYCSGLPQAELYNFDIKSWSTGTFFRNIETFGGWIVNGGSGTPYIIWMHGQAKIGQ